MESSNNDQEKENSVESSTFEDGGDIYGGEVKDFPRTDDRFDQVKHEADTTRWLAFILIGILVVGLPIHYSVAGWLHYLGKIETAEYLSDLFDKMFPAITALTGSVATYFFTKEK